MINSVTFEGNKAFSQGKLRKLSFKNPRKENGIIVFGSKNSKTINIPKINRTWLKKCRQKATAMPKLVGRFGYQET